MGLFDRAKRVIAANLNNLVSKAEDPVKMLEQILIEMQEDQVNFRQAVAQAISQQKRTEAEYQKNLSSAQEWENRAKLALNKGDENLAREALGRKKTFTEALATQKPLLDQQKAQVDQLKKNLLALESKINEAKTKKSSLLARAKAAEVQKKINELTGGMSLNGSVAAFERMENKVLDLEARAQAARELAGNDLEQQFAALQSGSNVDDELAALKAQVQGTAGALPPSSSPAADSLSLRNDAADSLEVELAKLHEGNNQ